MTAWIAAKLSELMHGLAVAFCYTLIGLLIVAVVALIVMIEVEKYKDKRRDEKA